MFAQSCAPRNGFLRDSLRTSFPNDDAGSRHKNTLHELVEWLKAHDYDYILDPASAAYLVARIDGGMIATDPGGYKLSATRLLSNIPLQRLRLYEECAGIGTSWELRLAGKINFQIQGVRATTT